MCVYVCVHVCVDILVCMYMRVHVCKIHVHVHLYALYMGRDLSPVVLVHICIWDDVYASLPIASPQPMPADEYDFVEEPPKKMICLVLKTVMLQPHQTTCCGLRLTAEAATRLQGMKQYSCPHCRETGFTSYPDIAFRREVRQLQVHCPNRRRGCEWVGELSDMDRHVESCPRKNSPLETDLAQLSQ